MNSNGDYSMTTIESTTAAEVGGDAIAYTVSAASRVSGVGRTTIWGWLKDGSLEFRRLGKKRLILRSSLVKRILSLPVA